MKYFTVYFNNLSLNAYTEDDEEVDFIDDCLASQVLYAENKIPTALSSHWHEALDFVNELDKDGRTAYRYLMANNYRVMIKEDGAMLLYSYPYELSEVDIEETAEEPLYVVSAVGEYSLGIEYFWDVVSAKLN